MSDQMGEASQHLSCPSASLAHERQIEELLEYAFLMEQASKVSKHAVVLVCFEKVEPIFDALHNGLVS